MTAFTPKSAKPDNVTDRGKVERIKLSGTGDSTEETEWIDVATQAELDAHAADTTSIHGITDTSALVTTSTSLGGDLTGTVGNAQIAAGAVGATELASDAVTNAKVADDAIGIAELSATGTPSSSTFLRGDNTWATPAGGGGGDLLAANNLSDLANAATARANLGLLSGSGSPEGVVTATVGRTYEDTSTGYLWSKITGTGNTGWQITNAIRNETLDAGGTAGENYSTGLGVELTNATNGARGDSIASDTALGAGASFGFGHYVNFTADKALAGPGAMHGVGVYGEIAADSRYGEGALMGGVITNNRDGALAEGYEVTIVDTTGGGRNVGVGIIAKMQAAVTRWFRGIWLSSQGTQAAGDAIYVDGPAGWSNVIVAKDTAGTVQFQVDAAGNVTGGFFTTYGVFRRGDPARFFAWYDGNPEGAVSASPGAVVYNTLGGTGTTIYYKASGTGNTGWVAVSSGGGGLNIADLFRGGMPWRTDVPTVFPAINLVPANASTATATTADRMYFMSVILASPITVTEIHIDVSSAGAGSSVLRAGIYYADDNWVPTSLLADWGTLPVDSTGNKSLTGLTSLIPAGRWVLAWASNGSPTLRLRTGQVIDGLEARGGSVITNMFGQLPYASFTYATFPATAPSLTGTTNAVAAPFFACPLHFIWT